MISLLPKEINLKISNVFKVGKGLPGIEFALKIYKDILRISRLDILYPWIHW